MRAALLLVAAIAGCGRFGFSDAPTIDGAADAQSSTLIVEVPLAMITGADFQPVAGAVLDLPRSPGVSWLFLVSASLDATTAEQIGVEARYLVDGVERGIGGTQNNQPGLGGPWQHFDVIPGAETPRHITFELREGLGGTATVRDLRAIAVPLPASAVAGMHYESLDPIVDVTSTAPVRVAAFPFAPAAAGPYLMLGLVNASDRPGESDVYAQWRDADGILTFDLQAPRTPWQSLFAMWIVDAPAANQYELWSHIGSGPGQLRNIRWLALPLAAFIEPHVATSKVQVSNGTTTPIEVLSVPTATPGSAARWIYIATVTLLENCDGPSSAQRLVGFSADDRAVHASDHIPDNCASDLTYGTFAALDAAPARAAIQFASGNGPTLFSDDAGLAVFGVPQ